MDVANAFDPAVIQHACKRLIPGWSEAVLLGNQVSVTSLDAGLTNKLFKVELLEPSSSIGGRKPALPAITRALYRVFGDNEVFYDATFELDVFLALARQGLAPKCIAVFPGGRIEEWLEGSPLLVSQLQDEKTLKAIAIKIIGLHKLDMGNEGIRGLHHRPVLPGRLKNWLQKCISHTASLKCPIVRRKIKQLDLDRISREIDWFLNLFVLQFSETDTFGGLVRRKDNETSVDFARRAARAIVFCHNDGQENNIMCHEGNLGLIDFEYSDYNFAAYDFANIFIEASLDNCLAEPPFYKIMPAAYPSLTQRRACLITYFLEMYGEDFSEDEEAIDAFLDDVELFTLGTHLHWCLWSIERFYCCTPKIFVDTQQPVAEGILLACSQDDNDDALSTYSDRPLDEFDFIGYAIDRMESYYIKKEELSNLLEGYKTHDICGDQRC